MNPAQDWRAWLPYGEAFRFVDEVREVAPPDRIVTATDYGARPDMVAAHHIASAVPGVLLGEQAAQSAWLLGRHIGWHAPGDRILLGRLNCTFERVVAPGSLVEAEVLLTVVTPLTAGFRATLAVGDEVVAKVILAVRRFPDDDAATA